MTHTPRHIFFIGAGIVSLVSVLRLMEYLHRTGTRDRYHITVIEQGQEAGCGITFGNGGNITPIEGLPAYRPTPAFPLLNSPGVTEASKQLVALGHYSLTQMQEFFRTHPDIAKDTCFQYSPASEQHFACIYATPEDQSHHTAYLHSLHMPTTLLPSAGTYDARGIEGGCLHARDFVGLLAKLLRQYGVIFRYNVTATDLMYSSNRSHIEALKVSDASTGDETLPADHVIVSTGCTVPFSLPITIYPVGGCTLTLPIPDTVTHYPMHPFKHISDKGGIVFSPHLTPGGNRPSHLRLGGVSWYDPSMKPDIGSPHVAQALDILFTTLRNLFPELYKATIPANHYETWVGFRPYSLDYLPIIGEVIPDSGVWINMGHGPGGTSYSFGAADILLSQWFPDFNISIPQTLVQAVSPGRFQY